MSYIQQYKTFARARPWTAITVLVLLSIILLVSVVRISLPFVINYGATNWLKSQGIIASVADIEISVIDGRFSIINASGKNEAGNGFSIGRFDISWQWLPLLDNQLIINEVKINSLASDILLFENGDKNIAGLSIKAGDEAEEDASDQQPSRPWDIALNRILLSDVSFCLQQFDSKKQSVIDYCAKLSSFGWDGNIGFKPSQQIESSEIPLYVKGTLKLNNIVIHNNYLKLDLLNTKEIAVNNIAINTLTDISINSVGIDSFSGVQRTDKTSTSDSHLFAFDRLDIQAIQLRQLNQLNTGKIRLTEPRSYIGINKKGELDFNKWIPVSGTREPAREDQQVVVKSEPFNYAFDEFILSSKQHILFVDNSLAEPFSVDIHNINLVVKQFDTSKPDKSSRVLLDLVIDKHGSLQLDANVSQLSKRPNIQGTGQIAGLDLRMLAPLTKQHIGHNIKSGQLDVDLKLNVSRGIINSNIGLTLHHFVLQTLSKEEAEKLNSELGIPLNSSLSLLRDKDNTIHLEIPVTGDIDNPEFDPKDAVITASSKAITTAVLHYYTPFGLVFAAGSLVDLATALKFEPVVFDAGTSTLNSSQMEQLDKLATLMRERPGIHLTLCGISNRDDKDSLIPSTQEDSSSREGESGAKQISDESLVILKKLADSRSSNIKQYLVTEKGIKASRLIECSAEYLPDQGSVVKISI